MMITIESSKLKDKLYPLTFEIQYLYWKIVYKLKRNNRLKCKVCGSQKISFFQDSYKQEENGKYKYYSAGVCQKCGAEVHIREYWISKEEIDKMLSER